MDCCGSLPSPDSWSSRSTSVSCRSGSPPAASTPADRNSSTRSAGERGLVLGVPGLEGNGGLCALDLLLDLRHRRARARIIVDGEDVAHGRLRSGERGWRRRELEPAAAAVCHQRCADCMNHGWKLYNTRSGGRAPASWTLKRPTQHAMIQQEATSRTHVYLFGSERTLVGRVSARSRSSGNPGHSRNSPGGYRKIL